MKDGLSSMAQVIRIIGRRDKMQYNETTAGFFHRCGSCKDIIKGGEKIYVPVETKGNHKIFHHGICESCYRKATIVKASIDMYREMYKE